MRSALLVVVFACSRPQAPPPALANRPASGDCDAAMFRAQAISPMRERLGDRELVVADSCYGVSRVVAKLPAAIVTATVNDHRLSRVVTRETPLWAAPGGAPLPGVVVEPGVEVTGAGDWSSVAPKVAIEAGGYVPTSATGLLWSAQPPPGTDGKKLGRYAEVFADPTPTAEHLASIPGSEPVFDRIDPGPAGWLHVTASDEAIRVTGWVAPPPPPRPPSALQHVYDFSDDVIEGDLVHPEGEDGDLPGPIASPHPLATGCIRSRPDDGGSVIGVVTGDLPGDLEDDGWVRVDLATPWGPVTGHARELQDDAEAE